LIIDLVHKVSNSVASSTSSFGWRASSLEDQDISFLSVVDLVEDFDAGSPRVQVVVEVADILTGKPVELSHLQDSCHRLLECDLVTVIQLHEEDVEEINGDEAVDGKVLNYVTHQEVAHDRQINQEKHGVSNGNPPINTSVLIRQRIKVALNNQGIEGTLLYSRLNSYIRHSKENTVHHDKAFCCRVRESK